MSRPRNLGLLALSSIPATSAASTATIFKVIFLRAPALAFGMAGIAGLFSMLGIVLVSSEVQETIRVWIRHRPEKQIAAAESFEIRRRTRAATCGRRWTATRAAKLRQDAAAYKRPGTSLSEIMMITRTGRSTQASPQPDFLSDKGMTAVLAAKPGDHADRGFMKESDTASSTSTAFPVPTGT